MTGYRVGIDLGTSYCSIGWVNTSDKVEVLRDDEGDPLMPSAVYFCPDGRSVQVGKAALAAGEQDPRRLVVETKRLMSDVNRRWHFDGVEYSPVDVAALLLRQLRTDFEARVGPIARAVVCVPAHYGVVERRLTMDAARQAGLPIQKLLDEPVAAALAQILDGQDLSYLVLAEEQLLLVYDLGGGTFDLSVVRYDNYRIKVLCTDGKLHLGGADWNRRLEKHVADQVEQRWRVRLRDNEKMWHHLENWVEQAKRRFSAPDGTEATFALKVRGRVETVRVTRGEFEKMTADLAEQTRAITSRIMRKAGGANDYKQLLAVGGGTHMPMIRKVLAGLCLFTPRIQRPNYRIAPELAVVEGAVLFARLWASRSQGPAVPADGAATAARVHAPPQFIAASARSLGVALVRPERGLTNHILIPKNSSLPASGAIRCRPLHRGIRHYGVLILEGDEEDLGACKVVGRCVLANLPDNIATQSFFSIALTLDESNMLDVVFKHHDTGKVSRARVDLVTSHP
jgi:molecular chaperone DnaK